MVGEPEVIIVLLIYGITSKTHESFWANPIYLTTNVPTLTKRHKRQTIQQRGQLEDDRGPGVTWREREPCVICSHQMCFASLYFISG